MSLKIYSDGSCDNKTGHGGWGWCISTKKQDFEMSGLAFNTTSNRMEMMAIINALKFLSTLSVGNKKKTLYTDSRYVADGINQWVYKWSKDNWQEAEDRQIKNLDLWKKLYDLEQKSSVVILWVRGHAGVPGNERADVLAGEAMRRAKRRDGL